MSLILLGHLTYKDMAAYQTYMELAGPIFMDHGVGVLINEPEPQFQTHPGGFDKVIGLEFRDRDHMKSFFAREDYAEAAVHRDKGADIQTMLVRRFQMPT